MNHLLILMPILFFSLDFYCTEASESCEKLAVWVPSYEIQNKRKNLVQIIRAIASQQAEAKSQEEKYNDWLQKLKLSEIHFHRQYSVKSFIHDVGLPASNVKDDVSGVLAKDDVNAEQESFKKVEPSVR